MGKKYDKHDKRIHFVKLAVFVHKLTDNAALANEWYISHKAKYMTNEVALAKFKEWMS